MDALGEIKIRIRECADAPFFTDEEIMFFYNDCKEDMNLTCYTLLKMKAENTEFGITGVGGANMADNSKYWLRLAASYKPNESRVL